MMRRMAEPKPAGLDRSLGVFSATTIIVGSMIGSGIFLAPSIMAGLVAPPRGFPGVWVVGGAPPPPGAPGHRAPGAPIPHPRGPDVFPPPTLWPPRGAPPCRVR